jgi:uncharacterized phiE125 gp8 family phage protein
MNYRYYNIPNIKLVTAPLSEPISVQEAKQFLRIDSEFEDALIAKIITSARILVEEYTKRSLITQSWKISFNDFAPKNIRLVRGPVARVTSIIRIDDKNNSQTIPAGNYSLSANNEYLVLNDYITGRQVEINYITGYGTDGTNIPEPLKLAILTLTSRIYERKSEAFKIDDELRSLINNYRSYEL